VDVNLQRIIHAVEFNRFADRRVDHPRIAQHCGLVTADAVEPIERPDFAIGHGCGQCAD
jgi:hypothetical protein